MKKSEALFGVARLPLDVLAASAALLLSYRLRQANIDLLPGVQLLEPATTLPPLAYYLTSFVLPGVLAFVIIAASLRMYTLQVTHGVWNEVGRILIAGLLWLVTVIGWYFLVRKQLFFSRALLLSSVSFLVAFSGLIRMSLRIFQRSLLRAGIGKTLVVSIGAEPIAAMARETLQEDDRYAYVGHLPSLEGLRRLTFQRPLDLVIQTDPNPESQETVALIEYCRSHHLGYGFLPPVLADVPHQLHVERLGLFPLIRFQPTPLDGWGRIFKRLFDIVASLLLMILLSPLLLLFALGVLLDGGWPIFYVSKRVGQYGRKSIGVLKFRSMRASADAEKEMLETMNHRTDGPLFKIKNDPRVTRFGRFLRRWSFDEFPQLFNVFMGHLSLVGPRPHLLREVERYSLQQRRVFAVKPGVTGLAQVSGRSDLRFDEEVRLDLQYIEEWSLGMDLWVLWRTLFVVAGRKGAD